MQKSTRASRTNEGFRSSIPLISFGVRIAENIVILDYRSLLKENYEENYGNHQRKQHKHDGKRIIHERVCLHLDVPSVSKTNSIALNRNEDSSRLRLGAPNVSSATSK